MQFTKDQDKNLFATALAKLEYVYPTSVEYVMASKRLQGLGAFVIDYEATGTVKEKDPLAWYNENDMFGPSESGKVCKQCGVMCQGHYGILRFPIGPDGKRIMIYHYQQISTIIDIFKVTCTLCSKLTLKRSDNWVEIQIARILNLPKHMRLKEVIKIAAKKAPGYTMCTCTETSKSGNVHVCAVAVKRAAHGEQVVSVDEKYAFSKPRKRVKATEGTSHTTDTTSAGKQVIRSCGVPRKDHDTLMLMSDGDLEIIGISREDIRGMFLEEFVVIPTRYRPRNGKKKNNKFTSAISQIIRVCIDYIKTDGSKYAETATNLQKLFKDYSEEWISMLKSKKGLYKGGIQAKKTGTSARGVAVPGKYLRNGEAMVSEFFASTALVAQMEVTEDNIELCQGLMDRHKVYMIQKVRGHQAGVKIEVLADNFADKSSHDVEVGDVIWRHGQDGDLMIIARQPIQNKQSITAVTMKVGKKGGPLTVATTLELMDPMAGDYDGDTLMLATAQTPEAREDMEKMLISRNIRSAQRAAPIYGLTYHTVLASALITLPNIEITELLWTSCLQELPPVNIPELRGRLDKYGISMYSSRGLLSVAFPPDFFYENLKDDIFIENGVYLKGILKGSIVGKGSGSIVDKMSIFYSGCGQSSCTCKDAKCSTKGWEITSNYITRATQILTAFLDAFGFTISSKDCFFGTNVDEAVTQAYSNLNDDIMSLKTPVGYFETIKYNKEVESLVNAAKSIPHDLGIFKRPATAKDIEAAEQVGNHLVYMSKIVAGAKGDEGNIGSISVLLGQQYLLGKVLALALTSGTRMLVTERPDSSELAVKGFIPRSYRRGLYPDEVFKAAHANREGITSTQTNTPDIGTLQKDLDKLMENLTTRHGGSVYNDEVIINFAAGGDSLDPEEILVINSSNQALDIDTILGSINSR